MEDFPQRTEIGNVSLQCRGIGQNRDTQQSTARSNREHCAVNRIARRDKERESKKRTEYARQVTFHWEAALSSAKSVSEPQYEVILSTLHHWEQRSLAPIQLEIKYNSEGNPSGRKRYCQTDRIGCKYG